ncbi:KRI1-like family-domain-containing protein [Apiospora phragmitis]|uniref:KRI1-like family-domain-containing protein n=1 Tax=Apiospora phragmitis TaxID=2905665 RepID=A0ABR1TRF8_9PEZI
MATPHPSRKLLFDESDDESDGGVKLQVNRAYAARFEHNKKREERQRLEEKFKTKQKNGGAINDGEDDESDSSSDEDEDEDGFLATEDLDAQISATLQAIRNKDPRIYDGKSTFYKPIEETPDEAAAAASTKEKPVTLKDYHRQRILAGDVGADEEEEAAPKTYVQEQADLKKSIRDEIQAQLRGADEDDEEDADFLKAKAGEAERVKAEVNQNGIHHSRAAKVKPMTIDIEEADKNPELYLSNFMAARAWMQPGNNWKALDSDEEEDDGKADEWEVAYNLRFEDPNKSNEVLRSYARDVAAAKSVRREEKTARQRQRDQEREQKEAEKRERREEKARLRKLKVEEAEKRLKQIKKAAGLSGKTLKEEDWVKFLNDAWDNDKWEEEMQRTFGDQYYAEGEGADEEEGDSKKKKKVKKPKWDDDIDIKDLVPDFEEEELPKIDLDEDEGETVDQDEMADEADEDEDGPASKRRKTTKDRKKEKLASQKESRQERAKLEALVDSKMDVDHEVLAGPSKSRADMPTFSYRQTWAESYGLTARDILMAPNDAALNEFVGLKKLAHFRPDDKKAKDKKRLGKKARLRQWRRETFGAEAEHDGPAFSLGDNPQDGEGVNEESQPSNNVVEGGSKKRKRSKKKKGTTADDAEA